MKKMIKWVAIFVGGVFVLFVLAIILIPLFVDINHYKPQIQAQVTKATGRSMTLGGDLKLSLFPWVGISLSDLHFGNPEGFSEEDMVAVDDFRVKIKVLPLLSKKVEVKEFVLSGARVILETRKDGTTGWQDLGKAGAPSEPSAPEPEPDTEASAKSGELPIADLKVGEFVITNSSLLWLDHKNDLRKEVKGFELILTDLSFDRPIGIKMSVSVDDYPIALNGTLGPVGKEPGKGTVPIDISLEALGQINAALKGAVKEPAAAPAFDLKMVVKEFSARELLEALNQPLPLEPADSNVLTKIGLSLQVAGSTEAVTVSNGMLTLDDSKLTFSAAAKEFSKPDLAFNLTLDQIDLDRYLPEPAESETKTEPEPEPPTDESQTTASPSQIDYTPLRKIVLEGNVAVNQLKVKNVKTENIIVKIAARNGLLTLNPFSMDLYNGQASVNAMVNVQKKTPKTDIKVAMKTIQAGALINDLLEKDILEGTLQSNITLSLAGDTGDQIKKTISGSGKLEFLDGAVKGVDLAAMAHNTAAAFGLTEKGAAAPKTEFTELLIPFTLDNGVFDTRQANLKSPVLHLNANGNANLPTEKIDFRVEPKFVSPLPGTGGKSRNGILVPVMVSGTFTEPKFRPDLKAALKHNLGVDVDKEAEKLKQDIKKEIEKEIGKQLSDKKGDQQIEKAKDKLKEEAQKLFKGLPFSK